MGPIELGPIDTPKDHLTGQKVGTGRRVGGLYYLESLCLPASASTSSTSASASVSDTAASACSLDRWHRRLGHPSRARLHTLSSSGSLGRVSSSPFSPCIGC